MLGGTVAGFYAQYYILGTAREHPRLPLRREVDACIKDLSRQTEGEIHRVCAKALDIGKSKSE